jgi:hypothetical protein
MTSTGAPRGARSIGPRQAICGQCSRSTVVDPTRERLDSPIALARALVGDLEAVRDGRWAVGPALLVQLARLARVVADRVGGLEGGPPR